MKRESLQSALNSLKQAQSLVASVDAEADTTSVGMPWIVTAKLDKITEQLATGAFRSFVTALYQQEVQDALAVQAAGKEELRPQDMAELAFVLSDPSQSGSPFIYVSSAFQLMSYSGDGLITQELKSKNPTESSTVLQRHRDASHERSDLLLNV